jgi:hypothetical protein
VASTQTIESNGRALAQGYNTTIAESRAACSYTARSTFVVRMRRDPRKAHKTCVANAGTATSRSADGHHEHLCSGGKRPKRRWTTTYPAPHEPHPSNELGDPDRSRLQSKLMDVDLCNLSHIAANALFKPLLDLLCNNGVGRLQRELRKRYCPILCATLAEHSLDPTFTKYEDQSKSGRITRPTAMTRPNRRSEDSGISNNRRNSWLARRPLGLGRSAREIVWRSMECKWLFVFNSNFLRTNQATGPEPISSRDLTTPHPHVDGAAGQNQIRPLATTMSALGQSDGDHQFGTPTSGNAQSGSQLHLVPARLNRGGTTRSTGWPISQAIPAFGDFLPYGSGQRAKRPWPA